MNYTWIILLLQQLLRFFLSPTAKPTPEPQPVEPALPQATDIVVPETPEVTEQSPEPIQPPVLPQNEGSESAIFLLELTDELGESTLSALYKEVDGNKRKICSVLEDAGRPTKIPARTRIPAGTYELVRRKSGKFYAKYKAQFRHEFVVMLKDVPGFTYILVHMGNTVENTAGCLLVGDVVLERNGAFRLLESEAAYRRWYIEVQHAFETQERVFIKITR